MLLLFGATFWQILQHKRKSFALKQFNEISGGCVGFYDGVLCWPSTDPDTEVILPCPPAIHRIQLHANGNVTKFCNANGTFEKANYSACISDLKSLQKVTLN